MHLPIDDGDQFYHLLSLPGPSGHEGAVRQAIMREIQPLGTPRVDALGNLTLTLGGDGPAVLFVAHMDEVGLLVTRVEDNGFLRFSKVGTIDDRALPGRPVDIHTPSGAVPAVITMPPPGAASWTWADLALDVGAADGTVAAARGIRGMEPVTFHRQWSLMNGRYLSGWALDDRYGCFALIRLLRHAARAPRRARLTFAWSVQEEIGLRGARALAVSGSYDVVIPVDVFATSAAPGHPRFLAYAELGAGPVLRVVDHGGIASPVLVAWLEAVAGDAGIPLQMGATGGETDGVPLQLTGAHMVPLTVAARYLHTAVQTVHLDDVAALIRLGCVVVDRCDHLPR